MILWVMDVGFENTYTVSGKCNVSMVVPRLDGWVCKIFSDSTPGSHQKDSHSAGSQSVVTGGPQFESYG